MKKEEYIERYGEDAYERYREQTQRWQEANPEKVEEHRHNHSRKGGSGYEKQQKYQHTGLQGKRNRIRAGHAGTWRGYKNIIAPGSQLHHQWRPGMPEYDGVALVEKDQHRHGLINVIQVLAGEITLFTEEAVKNRGDIECQ